MSDEIFGPMGHETDHVCHECHDWVSEDEVIICECGEAFCTNCGPWHQEHCAEFQGFQETMEKEPERFWWMR